MAISHLRETKPRLVTEDTEHKMVTFSKLMLLAEQYSPNSTYSGNVHLVKAANSFQVSSARAVCTSVVCTPTHVHICTPTQGWIMDARMLPVSC